MVEEVEEKTDENKQKRFVLFVCYLKEQIKLMLQRGFSGGEEVDVFFCSFIPSPSYLFSSNMNTRRQMGQDYKYTGKEEEWEGGGRRRGGVGRGGGAAMQANPRRQKINNSTPCCVRETLNV